MSESDFSYDGIMVGLILLMGDVCARLRSVPEDKRPFVGRDIGEVICASDHIRKKLKDICTVFEMTGVDKQDPRLPTLLARIK